MFETKKVKN